MAVTPSRISVDTDILAAEMQARVLARKSLSGFSRYTHPDEPPAAHHELMNAALDKVMEGKLRRLMVFMPPGSAKSTYSSVDFPSYYLGKLTGKSIISASYGEDLAKSFGRKVRNIIDTQKYQNVFPGIKLSEDSKAKGEWETNEGGSYYAAGVGTGITGRRADGGIIDDPVKGRAEADSELKRNETWQWYKSDFLTRLKPDNFQIIIQTRWHEDDLSGRILPETWDGESGEFIGFDGQLWTVICIPAEARDNDILGRKKGEMLWPEWFHKDFWDETRAAQQAGDVRNWNALYQQVPQPDIGVFFQRDWFKRYRVGDEPERLTNYGASDYAVTDGGGDFTEMGVGGFDKHEDLYFLDWWGGQTTSDVWVEEEARLAKKHDTTVFVAEGGQIRRAVEPWIKKFQRGYFWRKEWITSGKDKAANARSFQALAAQGKVYIPFTDWGEELINQLVKFIPNTNYKDDKVDVCGLFGRLLDKTYGPSAMKGELPPNLDIWGNRIVEQNSWKTV